MPARDAVAALLDHTRDALDAAGDTALVEDQVERLLARGNGATQQRRTFERTGSLADVVADAVARTEASWSRLGRAGRPRPIRASGHGRRTDSIIVRWSRQALTHVP